ncbi:MAG: hypothetical protein JNL58_21170 [Planctomyces sp.]|nr:hypothetical protein [Planctomyces sp.]
MPTPTVSRDASGRLAVEVFDIPIELFPSMCREIAMAFELSRDCNLVTNGVDVVFMDFNSEAGSIEMAWDNWSGFIVTAKSRESEPLVQRISEWLMDREIQADK